MKGKKRYIIIFLLIYLLEVLILSIMINDWEELRTPYKAELQGNDITKINNIDHIDSSWLLSRTAGSILTDDSDAQTITLMFIGKDQKDYTVTTGQDVSGFSAVVNERLNDLLLRKIDTVVQDSLIGTIISLDVQGYQMTVNISGVCRDGTEESRLYLSSEHILSSEIKCSEEIHVMVSKRSYLPDITNALDEEGITVPFKEEIEMVHEKNRTILICIISLILAESVFILAALRNKETGEHILHISNGYALAGVLIICSFFLVPLFRAFMDHNGFPIDFLAVFMIAVLFLIHEAVLLISFKADV